jgi:hypothetical protein
VKLSLLSFFAAAMQILPYNLVWLGFQRLMEFFTPYITPETIFDTLAQSHELSDAFV